MREIKFRALKDDMSNCNFAYGDLLFVDGIPRIVVEADLQDTCGITYHTCIKGTEGQYTGLKDKNGKEIYEGDKNKDGGIVVWNQDDASFCWDYKEIEIQPMGEEDTWCEIIGNIHEQDKTK